MMGRIERRLFQAKRTEPRIEKEWEIDSELLGRK